MADVHRRHDRSFALREAGGRKSVFSIFDPNIQVPYTIQSMVSVQHSLGRTMAAKLGICAPMATIFRCSGSSPRRSTARPGLRPNPALGAPGGYYVDSSQTMVYNGLQTSLSKRFSNRYSWDVNYTLRQERGDSGRRSLRVLHRGLREQPGLLGSGIRSRSVEQRRPSSFQRIVHL